MFNLAPPPNFRGLDPFLPVSVYYRHLPHWRQTGATYFVTFRQADALPQTKLRFLQRLRMEWERSNPAPRSEQAWEAYTRDIVRRSEAWLDEGHGSCLLRNYDSAVHLEKSLLHFQDSRYFLSCYVIMPNHCHLVVCPYQDFRLEDILQGIKGVAARRINLRNALSGGLWQEESYDRIIRDEEHLWRSLQYIGQNPRRAGLPEAAWRRWVHPAWEAAGWRFLDEAATRS